MTFRKRTHDRDTDHLDGAPTTEASMCALVVGYDGEDSSHHALVWAMGFAVRVRGSVHVVHVADLDDTPVDPDAASYEEDTSARISRERERAVTELDHGSAAWTYDAAHGPVDEALANLAERYDASMIVLGASTSGFGSALREFTGESVARGLARHSRRPVLTVPAVDSGHKS